MNVTVSTERAPHATWTPRHMTVTLRHSIASCAFVAALLASSHGRAEYTVTKTGSATCRTREIAWRVTLTRTPGLVQGLDRSISDVVPAAVTYVVGSAVPPPNISGTTLTWPINNGVLSDPGESLNFDFRTTFAGATVDVTNSATFNYYLLGLLQSGITGSRNVTTSCNAGLAVIREAPRCAPPGSVVSVTLRVSATQTANGAVLIESPPPGVTNITPANGGTYNAGSNTITWNIGSITAGATANVSYTFVAPTGPVTTGSAEAYASNGVATFVGPSAITGIVCDDGNVCTADSCDGAGVCVTTPVAGTCDDQDACTTNDHCAAGVCGGAALVCDDGNGCTDDGCDGVLGCVTADNTAACSDDDVCTATDQCAAGACVSGSAIVCDDGDVCSDDACDPVSGCFTSDNVATCDDQDACTSNDRCAFGTCAGAAITCDDGDGCTDDTCDVEVGCVTANNVATCDDDDTCTSNDLCGGGACSGTGPDCTREVTYGEVRLEDGTLRTFRCWRAAGVVDCETEPDSRRLVLFEGGMCSP